MFYVSLQCLYVKWKSVNRSWAILGMLYAWIDWELFSISYWRNECMYKSGIMTVAGKFLKNISQMIIFVQKYVK